MTDGVRNKNLGRAALFSATLIWGISFVAMKNVLTSIPPLYILAIRFCGAAIILLPACSHKLKKTDRSYLFGGVLMGLALLLGYVFQTFGLRLTTPGKNAFLTAAYCVIVPFLYWFFNKKRPDKFNAAAAAICIVGIGLISLDSSLSIGAGDILTIVCGFFFALHIIITARSVSNRDPVTLAMLQFAVAGIVALIFAAFFEPPPSGVTSADIWSMAFLTVISTSVCLLLQVFGQKYSPPSQAAVIMTLESVFGALSSVVFYKEILTPRLIAGFVLTFAAVIVSETKLQFLLRSAERK
ncbi:MAG: DMT family transporter [Oscillospiraceae bacterium]|jgi:drug/metabolite transporter (DMT)-like permease|nr:DMT family transporter [Oscillospiraceae bacterium]